MQNVQCKMQNRNSALNILHLSFCILHLFPSLSLLLFAFLGAPAVGDEPTSMPQKLLDDGWISLFDGETRYGWQPTGDAKWDVVDGEIRTGGDKAGFLMTTTEWADYLLHVEFKAAERTNSGVFLR